MAHYVVGDIQGCYDPLVRLLDIVNFDTNQDTLLCVGDLVNRGPKSLKVLRFLKSLENQCITVLGNHDIHLLSMFYGIRKPRSTDTLQRILKSSDAGELCDWLRTKPLLHIDQKRQFALCHAGIYPWWSLNQAIEYAEEVHQRLINEKKCIKLLSNIYSNQPDKWNDELKKHDRRRFIINAFTRMRFCHPEGHLDLVESGYNGAITENRKPWFHFKNDKLDGYKIIFGHWSSLGLLNNKQILALDTGCIWGGPMTLAKLGDEPNQSIELYQSK